MHPKVGFLFLLYWFIMCVRTERWADKLAAVCLVNWGRGWYRWKIVGSSLGGCLRITPVFIGTRMGLFCVVPVGAKVRFGATNDSKSYCADNSGEKKLKVESLPPPSHTMSPRELGKRTGWGPGRWCSVICGLRHSWGG